MGRNSSSKNNIGFTLVELLIVIAIMGILAAGIITLLNPLAQFQKAQDAKRKSDLAQIKNALEAYYNDHQAYPMPRQGASNTCLSFPNNATWECWFENKPTFMLNPNGTNYIKVMPVDPSVKDTGSACTPGDTSRAYGYYSPDGKSYVLLTRLENSSDPSIQTGSPNYHNGSNIDGIGCTGFANYKIQVP